MTRRNILWSCTHPRRRTRRKHEARIRRVKRQQLVHLAGCVHCDIGLRLEIFAERDQPPGLRVPRSLRAEFEAAKEARRG